MALSPPNHGVMVSTLQVGILLRQTAVVQGMSCACGESLMVPNHNGPNMHEILQVFQMQAALDGGRDVPRHSRLARQQLLGGSDKAKWNCQYSNGRLVEILQHSLFFGW